MRTTTRFALTIAAPHRARLVAIGRKRMPDCAARERAWAYIEPASARLRRRER
jgi:hypothetical protein